MVCRQSDRRLFAFKVDSEQQRGSPNSEIEQVLFVYFSQREDHLAAGQAQEQNTEDYHNK